MAGTISYGTIVPSMTPFASASGTCGTGCFLELNGSKVYDPAWWLKVGDTVTCSIEGLGDLTNTVVAEEA